VSALGRSFARTRSFARAGTAELPEQEDQTVLVRWRQVRTLPLRLEGQVAHLAAFIRREPIPVSPTLSVQPEDGCQDFAPRHFPDGSDGLQDPPGHRCAFGYPARGVGNGDDGSPMAPGLARKLDLFASPEGASLLVPAMRATDGGCSTHDRVVFENSRVVGVDVEHGSPLEPFPACETFDDFLPDPSHMANVPFNFGFLFHNHGVAPRKSGPNSAAALGSDASPAMAVRSGSSPVRPARPGEVPERERAKTPWASHKLVPRPCSSAG
jgi:hypothetical protein